jgi:DNA polymerase III delta prime subunit
MNDKINTNIETKTKEFEKIDYDKNMNIYKFHDSIYEKLDYFHKSNKVPHIIFHGSSGCGKRTIVNNFILKIYQNDKQKIKSNVLLVNCAHGKGIKFIRDELKFFAKKNIQLNNGILFKIIILLNADYLTIDAQSALRRLIELFSYNTRFFIIVENKDKLLNPILSRFCEIYVPDYIPDVDDIIFDDDENKKNSKLSIINLHNYNNEIHYKIHSEEQNEMVKMELDNLFNLEKIENNKIYEVDELREFVEHKILLKIANKFYHNGISCLDIINWVENTDKIDEITKSLTFVCFDKIKSEYRSENLLMLYMLDFIFMRFNKDVKSISTI